MSKKSESNSLTVNRNKLVPRLRFPEFKKSGEWKRYPLENFLIKNTKKNRDGKYTLIQSISNKHGFINQDEYFNNRIVASKNISNYFVIEKGTFAYNPSRIDVGSLAYKFDDKTSIISPLYISFKSNSEFLEDLFLLFWFDTFEFQKQMKISLKAGVRNTLSFENLIKIKISHPSTDEQQKIADCLSSIDEVITAETQKLEALKQHKKGLLQNLFPREGEKVPRLRFPEFKDSGEWDHSNGDKIFSQIVNKNHNSDLPILAITQEQGAIPRDLINFRISVTPQSIKNYKVVEVGDFIISLRSFQGGIEYSYYKGLCSPAYIVLRKKIDVENHFYRYYFKTERYIKELNKNLEGIRDGKMISYEQFSEIQIPKPSIEEQRKIVFILSSLDELINAQTEKLETLKNHKKGLLQGLFPEVN